MKYTFSRLWHEDDGVLSFEWTLLFTLVTIGIVTGLSAARDAIIDELGDVAQVMQAVDQSYHVGFPLAASVHLDNASSASDSDFTDAITYTDCDRAIFVGQLPPIVDDGLDGG